MAFLAMCDLAADLRDGFEGPEDQVRYDDPWCGTRRVHSVQADASCRDGQARDDMVIVVATPLGPTDNDGSWT